MSTKVGKRSPNNSQPMTRDGRRPSVCRRTARIHQDSHMFKVRLDLSITITVQYLKCKVCISNSTLDQITGDDADHNSNNLLWKTKGLWHLLFTCLCGNHINPVSLELITVRSRGAPSPLQPWHTRITYITQWVRHTYQWLETSSTTIGTYS